MLQRSLLRIITAATVVSCHFYYLISQTRYMSATLFHDYSHEYDSPHMWQPAATAADNHNNKLPSSSSQQEQSSSSTKSTNNANPLPKWLSDYFNWHIQMRKKYPGDTILTHPDSPGVLVKVCAYKCGGLHDRLGGLGWDLYLANQTRRVFLIHWCIPAPIENYLVPNLIDWTLPYDEDDDDDTNNTTTRYDWDERLFSNTTEAHIHCDRAVEQWHGLFDGFVEYMQGHTEFFEKHVDIAIDRAVHGNYSKHKVLRYKVLGVDQRLEQRLLVRHNETDPIAWSDAFPALFWTLFKPSEGLQIELDGAFRDMKISTPFDYNAPPFYAIHARIRHPRGHVGQEIEGKKGNPDKTGLIFDGATKQFAINVAQHALECAQKKHLEQHALQLPEYAFYADSEELVEYMGNEYSSDGVRVRNMTGVEVLHIDRQQQHPPESYYSAFVDLFVAAQAS